jgi:ubiquinone/menaquinone biosynthesis C-methylase UbiE
MKLINTYHSDYKKILYKEQNYLEPAENFLRIYKQNFFKKKLKCLDFGFGDGRHTKFLLENQNKVLATDISNNTKKILNKRLPKFKNFIILKNDYLNNINLFKNKFDLIVCWETIHWLGNYQKILKTIEMFNKILKKKSHLIITFPAKNHYLLKNP